MYFFVIMVIALLCQ